MDIDIENVTKRYDKGVALKNISLQLPTDQVLGILGPSGGGKSTLLKILAGLIQPDTGKIVIDHEELSFKEKAITKHRRSVGVVFQQFNLFPHLTALENLTLPLIYVHGYTKEDANSRAMELLDRFQLSEHSKKKPIELSGGQNQRVAILRAIAIRPKILLFDEPTSALDPIMTAEVLALIAEIKKESRHFILVTHHVHFAKTIADKIAFMEGGRLLELTEAEQFFKSPTSEGAKQYLEKVLIY